MIHRTNLQTHNSTFGDTLLTVISACVTNRRNDNNADATGFVRGASNDTACRVQTSWSDPLSPRDQNHERYQKMPGGTRCETRALRGRTREYSHRYDLLSTVDHGALCPCWLRVSELMRPSTYTVLGKMHQIYQLHMPRALQHPTNVSDVDKSSHPDDWLVPLHRRRNSNQSPTKSMET